MPRESTDQLRPRSEAKRPGWTPNAARKRGLGRPQACLVRIIEQLLYDAAPTSINNNYILREIVQKYNENMATAALIKSDVRSVYNQTAKWKIL